MGAFDEGPLADPEYHEPVPRLIPSQERHVVHPPADHDKLVWCRETIKRIGQKITRAQMVRDIHGFDALLVTVDLRGRLGDPLANNSKWVTFRSTYLRRFSQPYKGTWERAMELECERERLNGLAAPITVQIEALKSKRIMYRDMEYELESNIKHWEGA